MLEYLTSELEARAAHLPRDDAHGQRLECGVGSLLTDDLLEDLFGEARPRIFFLHG